MNVEQLIETLRDYDPTDEVEIDFIDGDDFLHRSRNLVLISSRNGVLTITVEQ